MTTRESFCRGRRREMGGVKMGTTMRSKSVRMLTSAQLFGCCCVLLLLQTANAQQGFRRHDDPSSSSPTTSDPSGEVGAMSRPLDVPSRRILTEGRLHRVKVGETLTLRCSVENLGLNIHDGGEYRCEIEGDQENPITIVHTVEILVPPSVMTQPPTGQLVVRRGAAVTMECKANGNPTPSVSWVRLGPHHAHHHKHSRREWKIVNRGQNNRVTLSNNGMILTVSQVGRTDAGRYRCQADNGVGEPAVRVLNLNVLYKPDIDVPAASVQGGEGMPATLVCLVHAQPPAKVQWEKNGMEIDKGTSPLMHADRYQMKSEPENEAHRSRHTLHIESVGVEDLANYSCVAVNSMGREKAVIELKGNPERPVFDARVVRKSADAWRLSWSTKSYANITEYRLLFRKLPDNRSQTASAPPPQQHSKTLMLNGASGDNSEWNNVVLPHSSSSVSTSSDYYSDFNRAHARVHRFAYEKLQLEPGGARYEAVVQAKNKFGWSDRSEMLVFATESEEDRRSKRRRQQQQQREEKDEEKRRRRKMRTKGKEENIDYDHGTQEDFDGNLPWDLGEENTNSARTSSGSSVSSLLKRIQLVFAAVSLILTFLAEQMQLD